MWRAAVTGRNAARVLFFGGSFPATLSRDAATVRVWRWCSQLIVARFLCLLTVSAGTSLVVSLLILTRH